MNDRSLFTTRLFFGLVVLALGVLWTLDNLGLLDASAIVRWWPVLALAWGAMYLTGLGCRRRPIAGTIWTVVGGVSLLHTLGITRATVPDLWPLFLIVIGSAIVFRAWRGVSWMGSVREDGPRLSTFTFLAGAERKVVAQAFRSGEVSAVMGGATVDMRSAGLAEGQGVVDVFAMWGGIELIVPAGWRVVGEVTPILGGFADTTAPPADPAAPTLVVRGLVVMGGVEVKNEPGRREYVINEEWSEAGRSGERGSRGFAGVVLGARSGGSRVIVRRRAGGRDKEIRIGPEGITVRKGPLRDDAAGTGGADRPPDPE